MKALIIFGSTTGNTEEMANIVKNGLEDAGAEVEVKEVTDAEPGDLTGGHDVILLGCPAYGDEENELQEDFTDYYDQLDDVKMDGKPFAVFAPGDSSYQFFCGSVDMLEEKLEALGGKKMQEGLKIDGDPGEYEDETLEWAKSVISNM